MLMLLCVCLTVICWFEISASSRTMFRCHRTAVAWLPILTLCLSLGKFLCCLGSHHHRRTWTRLLSYKIVNISKQEIRTWTVICSQACYRCCYEQKHVLTCNDIVLMLICSDLDVCSGYDSPAATGGTQWLRHCCARSTKTCRSASLPHVLTPRISWSLWTHHRCDQGATVKLLNISRYFITFLIFNELSSIIWIIIFNFLPQLCVVIMLCC